MKFAAGVACLCLVASSAHAADWKIGDKVQGYNVDWYDATIVAIGSGNYAGYYRVHYDKFSAASDQYLKADSIRARPGAAAAQKAGARGPATAPLPGRYVCMGYSGGPGQFRWYLQLGANTYRQTTPDLAEGRYSFDAAKKRLDFTSGPYRTNNWIGLYSVEREGRTQKITLRDKANDAKGPRVGEYSNISCTLSSG
jgi:hypothetical protein